MKAYLVWADDYDYDDYDAIVVIAENEDDALDMANNENSGKSYFEEWQGEIHVEEIDMTTKHIVLESYNAG